MPTRTERTLVLGIGNLLMGDEGIGVHAVRRLEATALPEGVDVVDGGTGGFHLLSYFEEYGSILMIDATMDGRPPGTIRTLKPKFASDYPKTLTAHDIGLKDLVETAAILQHSPDITLITVSIEKMQPMETELSAEVASCIPDLERLVRDLLKSQRV